jgi:hypothetical protein
MTMEVIAENLLQALRLAIEEQQKKERAQDFAADSALVAGWKQLEKQIESGEVSIITLTW